MRAPGWLVCLVALALFAGCVSVRIGREVDSVGREGQLLELGENLLFSGDNYVFRFEIVFNVDTESALGQVLHVAE